ncbi:lamin tail domain-containing protein, partial [candidate division TA06 bacterium]|nr:lamin tail domain-containing protein [candidate division TA06 bacterium]
AELPDSESNWHPSYDSTGSTPGRENSEEIKEIEEVVINEVMANVKGTDSGIGTPGDRNEFVELFNLSSDLVDVEGWLLDDGDSWDVLRAWSDTIDSVIEDPDVEINTTRIPPGAYAVILDPEYPDSGDGSYVQPYDFPPNTIILTVGNTSLGDGLSTTDPLFLYSRDTLLIDTYGTPFDTTDTIPFDPGNGISMERIDPALPDEESNWRPSVDSTGSTPGRQNSKETVVNLSPVVQLFASPDPFSPDGDGMNDETVISFELPFQMAKVRLLVYDRTGRVRKALIDQELRGSQESVNWDGRDNGGKILPIGVYILLLEATDDATGSLVTAKRALTLAKRLK